MATVWWKQSWLPQNSTATQQYREDERLLELHKDLLPEREDLALEGFGHDLFQLVAF